MGATPTQRQRQGENSREAILDATERLMAEKGYAATSISDIRKACGLPASSLYWHFGSKEGVLAAVMERGADRFFAGIPSPEAEVDIHIRVEAVASLLAQHPDFLRLVYMLGLERTDDPTVSAAVRRVRDTAIAGFRGAIASVLPAEIPPTKAELMLDELAALATALSDGVFIAHHLEPESTNVALMYQRLFQAISALIPIMLEEK